MKKNNIKYFIFLCFILLSTFSAFSNSLVSEDVVQASKLTFVNVDINNIVSISNPEKMNELNIFLDYFPRETISQKVINSSITLQEFLVNKNLKFDNDEVLNFLVRNKFTNEIKYGITSGVESSVNLVPIRSKIEFPKIIREESVLEYLLPTDIIDSDNENVVRKANEIINDYVVNKDDYFEIVVKLAMWVNKNIEYDLSTMNAQASFSSSHVLRVRNGVCDELTNLFIGFLRAVGIPARFVSGIAHTNVDYFDDNWGLHGWAEVYFPGYGWVAFDPTYGQFGFVDSTHIVLNVGRDSRSNDNRFTWRESGSVVSVGQTNVNTDLLYQSNLVYDYNINIEIKPIVETLGFGSYQVLEFSVENNNDFYVAPRLFLSQVKNVEILGDDTLDFVIGPKEKVRKYVLLKLNEDFNKDFIYTIPFSAKTFFEDTASTSFTLSSRGMKHNRIFFEDYFQQDLVSSLNIDINCQHKKIVYPGERVRLECNVINNDVINYQNVEVCLEKKCEGINLDSKSIGEIYFDYFVNNSGSNIIIFEIKVGQKTRKSMFNLNALDEPKVDIEIFNLPQSLKYDDNVEMSLKLIKESFSVPRDTSVNIFHPNFNRTINFEDLNFDREVFFNISGHFLDAGDNKINFTVSYYDENKNQFSNAKEVEISLIDLSPVEWLRVKFRQWLRIF